MFSVFCNVSFVFVSLVVIMCLCRTVATMMVSGMHNVWMMHVAREQWDMASAFALRLRARWLSSGPADSQPVASDTRNHMMLLCVCKCMLLCECMCIAGEARMRAACVSSVLCTRVLVCKAQGSECGRGMRGEARCATCLFTLSPFLPAGEMAYILLLSRG